MAPLAVISWIMRVGDMTPEAAIHGAAVGALLGLGATELGLANGLYRRYQQPWLRTYLRYLICTLLFGFFAFIGQNLIWRAVARLIDDVSQVRQAFVYFPLIATPFLIIAWFLLVRLFAGLVGQRPPDWFLRGYFPVMGALFALFAGAVIATDGHPVRFISIVRWAQLTFATIQLGLLLLAATIALRGATGIPLETRRRSIRTFVAIFLGLELTRIVLSPFVEDRLVVALPFLVLFFGGDLVPLVYLRTVLARHWLRRHDELLGEAWQPLLLRYDITPRQAEIVSLVCQGKSNQEIADELSISLTTVKTHLYTVFSKTGVKNRVQLSTLFSAEPET